MHLLDIGVIDSVGCWCICFRSPVDREDVVKKYETLITSSSSSLSALLVTNDVMVVRKLCSQGFLAAVAYLARTKLETKEFCAIAMA